MNIYVWFIFSAFPISKYHIDNYLHFLTCTLKIQQAINQMLELLPLTKKNILKTFLKTSYWSKNTYLWVQLEQKCRGRLANHFKPRINSFVGEFISVLFANFQDSVIHFEFGNGDVTAKSARLEKKIKIIHKFHDYTKDYTRF